MKTDWDFIGEKILDDPTDRRFKGAMSKISDHILLKSFVQRFGP